MTKPDFTIQTQSQSANSATFVVEPLPQGYGQTLGNSLRRVLYSSIPGAAITTVTISGASHQFTAIEGVKEDAVELVLNLKQVRVAYTGEKPTRITIAAKGPGEVKAGDFEVSGGATIANPDLVIAHLADKNSKLEIEATVESGYGYSPADDRKSSTVGVIPMDASFSPVVRVNFSVESTRVGRLTNFDKLVLEITTDGTITPGDALTKASEILVTYFSAIAQPQVAPTATTESANHTTPAPAKTNRPGSNISVEELDLPTRIANALQKAGMETVADLLTMPKAELAKVKNLGGKSVDIVESALKERGFELV